MSDLTEEQKLVERAAELLWPDAEKCWDYQRRGYLAVFGEIRKPGFNPYLSRAQAWDLMVEQRVMGFVEEKGHGWWPLGQLLVPGEEASPDPITALLKAVIAKLEVER